MSGISKQYLGYMMSCFTKPKQPLQLKNVLNTSPKTKGLEKKHRSFIASPPKKIGGAFVIYPLVN